MDIELLSNPAFPRALVVGLFGGAGLSLTIIYSRRGPMIYVPYAALLVALALLLSRYAELSYFTRFAAALGGFAVASAAAYVTAGVRAERQRVLLRLEGRLPATARGPSLWGHIWRASFLLALGSIASAAVAFVAV